jgi:hypothetical protein
MSPNEFHLSTMTTPPPKADQPWRDGLSSLIFWICLFVAAAMYAAVSLAPKLLTYLDLELDYRFNQWKLVELDRQVSHLDKVIEAQTSDPAFILEQVRSAFDVARPNEQRISVESHLRLNIEGAVPAARNAAPTWPWYAPLVAVVAQSHEIGTALLCAAAALVLFAFTFLYDRRHPLV